MYRATAATFDLLTLNAAYPTLPREIGLLSKRLVNPVRRASLDLANCFCHGDRRRQFGEQVDVIFHTIHEVQLPAELTNDAAEVGEEPRFKRGIDDWFAFFRRVDDVRE